VTNSRFDFFSKKSFSEKREEKKDRKTGRQKHKKKRIITTKDELTTRTLSKQFEKCLG
jgi:hypothetical protein